MFAFRVAPLDLGADAHNSGAVAAQLLRAGSQRHARRLWFAAFGAHPAAHGGPLAIEGEQLSNAALFDLLDA